MVVYSSDFGFSTEEEIAKGDEKRKRKKKTKGDDLVVPEISLDLQIEIMTRLPAKSLMRFKFVSKLWSCLIRSRFFSNRYLTLASPPRQPRLYMSLMDHQVCDSMEVCHNPCESVLLSLSSSSNSAAESLVQDLALPGTGGHNMMVLRGLILNTVCRKACIYNPATRQSVNLPAIKSNIFAQKDYRKSVVYFLGHDPVLDQYKVVCTVVVSSKFFERITSEHWVFVLEAGGSWKRIEFDQQPHIPTRRGLCINGVIYYFASTCYSRSVVVSFDVRSEEFNMIQVPHVIGERTGFIEYGGRPAVFEYTNLGNTGLVDLWDLGDGGKWSKKSLVLQASQMHLVDKDDINFIVEGTTRNGEVILSPYDWISPYYILYYDLQKNDMRKVVIRGIPDHWFGKLDDYYLTSYIKLMDKNESIMHLET